MKKAIIGILLVLNFISTAGPLAAADWEELKGDHFIVYYFDNERFAKDALNHAEKYYTQIASDLGYARFNFWQWENRVKIYIYLSKADYTKATGQPEWTEGIAVYDKKQIITYAWSEHFLDALLPHEITHLIFRDFVGFKGEIPLWLDEGIAQWEEPKKRELSKLYARQVLDKQQMFPLVQLTGIKNLKNKDQESVDAFYMQALSVVDFLIATYGTLSFSDFCRELRDGKTINDALRFTYSGRLKDLDDVEAKWVAYVKKD